MGSRLVSETARERYGGDESADGAVTMLFAAVGVEVLGSETAETNLRTVLLPCYLQLLGWRCWGARLRRRICGRCCYHAICSCLGGGAGERDCGDESADGAVAMLFAAVGVEVLGSETAGTNLRTVLLPCYLQLLGWRCWGARLRRRICGRCCYHAICSCWGGGAAERDCGDESADGAVTMLFAAVGVGVLGSETAETNLRTVLLPCYLQLLGWRCWGARLRRRICGRCCYYAICSCWGGGAAKRDCGDESADGAVTMLFAAVGVEVLGSETAETDESADGAVTMLFAAVGVHMEVLGSETAETNLRTVLLPCYLQLLGWRCWGARRRRRICGRCCCNAICSCWGGGAGERDCGDESADGAVTMLFAAVGVEVLGSETAETNLRTVLLQCYLQLLGWRCWGARLRRRICGRCCWGARRRRRICGRCCCHAICSCWGAAAGERDGGDESADGAVAMLFACSCWGAIRRRRICGRCCCHAICSCWGAAAGERDGGTNLRTVLLPCYLQLLRDGGDESADAAVAMLFAAVGVQLLGSDTEETDLRTLLLPCYLQLLGCSCWGAIRRRRICGRCCYHAICSCWGGGAGEGYGGDESADAAVTMLFAAVGVQLLGSETAEMKLRTVLLPCELGIGVGGNGAADGGGGGCCCLNKRSLRGPDFGPLIF